MGRAENKVAAALVELTELHGGFAEKVHNEGHIGCPDYVITLPPGAFNQHAAMRRVETKAKNGVVSPMQQYYHAQLYKRGVVVFIPRSVDDVVAWFDLGWPEVKHV
jgi:hypothetical protein